MSETRTSCGLVRFLLLALPFALALLDGPLAAQTCKPLTASVETTITSYVQREYNLPKSTKLRVTQVAPVARTCYRRILVESASTGVTAVFYLSPDEKFLTRSLIDLSEDPRAAALRSQRDTMQALLSGTPPSRGPASARLIIVEFGNFECPYCARFFAEMKTLPPREARSVRVIFLQKLFPRFEWGTEAAGIAGCAELTSPGAFWKMHDFIYTHQGSFTTANVQSRLVQFAKSRLRISPQRIADCVTQHEYDKSLDHDQQLATQFDVMRTPTLFINGQRYVGAPPPATLRSLIERAVSGAPMQPSSDQANSRLQ